MKGFKNSTRMRSGHHFASGPREVGPYLRRAPIRKAVGGVVDTGSTTPGGNALTQRSPPGTVLDSESGGRTGLRPGFAKGGAATKGSSGTKAACGAAIARHVATPAPKGHKGLGKAMRQK